MGFVFREEFLNSSTAWEVASSCLLGMGLLMGCGTCQESQRISRPIPCRKTSDFPLKLKHFVEFPGNAFAAKHYSS
jgi:hypothetical protein